jgi:hypothetical protein
LVGKESVSGSPAATGRGISQENPPMRIYVIGNDGITLYREPLATVTEGEIAVTSKEELQAARSAASGCWRCGMHCPVSRSGKRSGIARR